VTIAVVFPGQGAQSVGMLADLAADQPEVVNTFSEAADILGKDLWTLSQTRVCRHGCSRYVVFRGWCAFGAATC